MSELVGNSGKMPKRFQCKRKQEDLFVTKGNKGLHINWKEVTNNSQKG